MKDPWDGYQDIRTIAAVCAIVAKKEEIMLDLTNERTPVDPKPLRLVGVLNDAGYHAYLVGGCVRDYVLGRPVHDYDLNTSATPEEIASLFPGSVLVGNNFGVSRVEFEGEVFEVGTFRLDGVYTDSRRPDSVVYTTDVLEDLKRRDFVMNTLLMDRDGNVIDHLGARLDLTSEVVRCVGDPEQRFREDKLRMLRAVRFAAKLQFKLDGATFRAIKKMWADVLDVPTERVRDELTLTLTSGDAVYGLLLLEDTKLMHALLPEVLELHGCDQNPKHHPEGDVYVHTMGLMHQLKYGCSPTLAWAALLHDISKPATRGQKDGQPTFYDHEHVGARKAEDILSRLKFPVAFKQVVFMLVSQHMKFRVTQEMRRSKLLKFVGQPLFPELLALHKLDASSGSGKMDNAEFCEKVLAETPEHILHPVKLVTGRDLIERFVEPGPFFRNALEYVATEQLEGNISDRKQALRVLDEIVAAYKKVEPLVGPNGVAARMPEAWKVVMNVAGSGVLPYNAT